METNDVLMGRNSPNSGVEVTSSGNSWKDSLENFSFALALFLQYKDCSIGYELFKMFSIKRRLYSTQDTFIKSLIFVLIGLISSSQGKDFSARARKDVE